MSFLSDFNPDEVKDEFSPLPKGDYEVHITAGAEKDTKAGDGKYIALSFQVVQGAYEGRILWENLNVVNKNQIAVNRAKADLKKIIYACGKSKADDFSDLENISIIVSVDIDKEDSQRNRIKNYKPMSGNSTVERKEQSATESAPSSKPPPPWKKK